MAGLLSEQLIENGYRMCIVDPEGVYAQMGQRPEVLTFGHDLALPSPGAVTRLLSSSSLSMVLTMSSLAPDEQLSYVDQLLAVIQEVRDSTELPHWLVIDEAHYFFGAGSPALNYLSSSTGNLCLVTYRPSLLADDRCAYSHQHESRGRALLMTKILQAHQHLGLQAHEAVDALKSPSAGLLVMAAPKTAWRVFTPVKRISLHAHHARKYADTRLPDDKAFNFLNAGEALAAHNILKFYEAVQNIPLSSLRHHLLAADFSRWVGDVIGDQQLA
jgi:hypothetical protein